MQPVEDHSSYLTTLLELGRTLNASLDLQEVMHIAIEQVVKFARAERGFIVLVEEGTNRILARSAYGIEPMVLEAVLTGRDPANRPEVSKTIIEQALREGKPVVSMNAMEDPRFAYHTSVRLAQVRSVLCVPLVAQGRALGVIYLDNRVRSGVFEERHEEMVTAFANQAAIAIENARLYENLRHSLEERLRLQQELHDKEMQRLALEEAGRLKSDFMSYLSHELRNPITAIRGYVQTLAADKSIADEMRDEFYETIESECDRMLNLINELLDSSRLEAGRPLQLNARRLDLGTLLRTMARAARFNRFWKETHCLDIDVAEDLPEIEADEDKVRQVMANLLNNATKYSPDGGTISVRARPMDEGVEITVRDEGIGISEELRPRLFGRYDRLDRHETERIPGTGLGLYLTRRLVELHGGTISCESSPGQGSTFRVRLPSRQNARAQGLGRATVTVVAD